MHNYKRPNQMSDYRSGVYLIGSRHYNWYKIGSSGNLDARLASFKSLPFTIDTQYTWETEQDAARETEHKLHAMVSDRRLRANGGYSEWFNLGPDDLRRVSEYMGKADSLTVVLSI